MQANSHPIQFPGAPEVARSSAGFLPVPPAPLLGREPELGHILALLDRDDLRLVTLLGPGGVGKTRLALEVARVLHPDFADGATFVPLESIRQADLVPGAVARALGIQEALDRDIDDVLSEAIAGRHQLLVLDNIEQVVDAAPWISSLLARTPRLKALVTSRVPLNIGGEQQVTLAPLPVPEGPGDRTVAVELFLDRARAVNVDFDADATTIAAVGDVCRRLDGLPLAIELAAVRMRVLSVQALLGRLTHRLELLTGGRRDVPLRLRSMRDAIGWSYELLSAEEKQLFRRLSVFLGGFTLEPASFVASWPEAPCEVPETLNLIESLVAQSLVRMVTGAAEPQYGMLETIREFGLDETQRIGELDLIATAHAEYYRSVARHAERALLGAEQVRLLERLERDYPNVLAAIDWLERHGRLEDAVSLVAGIQFFLTVRGHGGDFIERLERWLDDPALARPGHTRGLALLVLGGLLQNTGAYERSVAALSEAVELLREAGDQWFDAMARGVLAATYAMAGEYDRMRDWATSALDLARPLGHHRSVSTNLSFLAFHARIAGDSARTRVLMEDSNRVAVENGDVWVQAFDLSDRAEDALAQSRINDGEALALESLRLFEAVDSRRDLPGAWRMLALVAMARGDLDTAAVRVATGMSIAEGAGYMAMAQSLKLLSSQIALARGDLVSARDVLRDVLGKPSPDVASGDTVRCLEGFALLMARSDDIAQAIRTLEAANQLLQSKGMQPVYAEAGIEDTWRRTALRKALGEHVIDRVAPESGSVDVASVIAEARAWQLPAGGRAQPESETTHGLSPRELQVLHLMAAGMSNQQIADELYVSPRTVMSHVTSILGKLEMPSRTAAVSFAIRHGIA